MDKLQEHKERDVTGTDSEQLPVVLRVVATLLKVLGGKRLYSDNNPRLDQFTGEFRAALAEYFDAESELVLTIQQYDILWRGNVIYHNDKRDESLAFLLYKDGVGEVTLHSRSLEGEIDPFLQIITEESVVANHGDEDVVTRLWNADFDHISYRVIDDYLASDLNDDGDDGGEVEIADQPEIRPSLEDKGRVIVSPSDPLESIDSYIERLLMAECKATSEDEREAYFQSQVQSFFAQGDAELQRYHAERDTELRDDGLAAFAETILVFTLLEDNPSAVRDVSGVLEHLVDHVVLQREPGTLTRLIGLVRRFRGAHPLPDNIAEVCDRIEDKLTDHALVRSFESELESWSTKTEQVLAYFICIGRPVVDPLLKILHRIEGGRLHREICNVLIAAAGEEVELVLDRMDVDNPDVAKDALYIAGRIQITSVTPRIQELLYYPDRKIRGEVLELIGRIDDPAVPELLMSAVKDTDKEIRCKAMQVAAVRGLPEASRHLNEVAFGKELQELDLDEQESVFKALGHVGDAVVVEHLRKFAEKRRLIDFSGNRDNKLLATRALEFIQEPSAVELLQKLSRDSNEAVRTRAMRALTALRTRMRNSGAEE